MFFASFGTFSGQFKGSLFVVHELRHVGIVVPQHVES